MNILSVYPEMTESFWSMKETLKLLNKKAWFPPLGLLTVASLLPQNWSNRLVDLNVSELKDEEIMWADFVFISAMNVQENSVYEIIKRCINLDTKIVAGGPLFTHEYHKFEGVDHFVLNEAEITLPQFLNDLENGSPKHIYQTNDFVNVYDTPSPKWELIDLNNYLHAIIQYSRGCPYNCDFCDVTALYGRRMRTKSNEQIIDELNFIHNEDKFFQVFFADDNLIGNKKRLKEDLLPAIIEWRKATNPAIWFATQVSINLADDPELMQLMLEAGFRYLFIGIETPDEESLDECNKKQNKNRDLLNDVKKLHRLGFAILGGFIIGFDTDTLESYQKLNNFLQKSGIVQATINLLKAPPGTDLFRKMEMEGRLLPDFSFHELQSNVIPKIDPELLTAGTELVIKNAYYPEYVYKRIKTFFQDFSLPELQNKDADVTLKLIKHLPKIIFQLGIIDKYRILFWKIILSTLFSNRRVIGVAFFNCIVMYQLRKLYDSYKTIS